MNKINPKKLLQSKWTALQPKQKQKHFIVVDVEFDDADATVESCTLEAVLTRAQYDIDWHELTDDTRWVFGWKS
ncbi:TIGR02450 family Trp-rich protein [Shewanella youngdeokensis]|uniref:TIGR02450 family Trp-rich protein n=1 Tax=Shewanella youngdeokensis TaxID=2999068 RepID=A0ABZ0JZ62_9GAMM|nr:TIGR02450 family Trp-rich protein [Shewanella sp. DAU334]